MSGFSLSPKHIYIVIFKRENLFFQWRSHKDKDVDKRKIREGMILTVHLRDFRIMAAITRKL